MRFNFAISDDFSAAFVSFMETSTSVLLSWPDLSFASHLGHNTPMRASKEQIGVFKISSIRGISRINLKLLLVHDVFLHSTRKRESILLRSSGCPKRPFDHHWYLG